ncbi:MAG: DUF899 domain-containing protein [Deltaproteobacteria bacterium]|nr:DUF899 domain-containing protein [Deltaproteobacteria bacterium]
MTTSKELKHAHPIVSREAWLKARKAHLAREKAFTKERDALSAERRELPWVKIDKQYVFDGPNGKVNFAELFDGRSQLLVYHFMFDPEWTQGCKSCSLVADHYNPSVIHLHHRDVTMVTISRAPIEKLLAFRKRMGWTFPWFSSLHCDFNQDFNVSFTEQELASDSTIYNYESRPYPISELPGMSVFRKDSDGSIYHTYSTYARGLDMFLGVYHLLDITPKGRDEGEAPDMSWVRHHDRYEDPTFIDPWVEHAQKKAQGCCACKATPREN